MGEVSLFQELCSVLRKAGIEIRIEPFQTPSDRAGGLCRMKGKNLVILDQNASESERARALLEIVEAFGLSRLGLTGTDLSPQLLASLNRRGKMTWPHKSQAPSLAKGNNPTLARALPLRPTLGLHLVGVPQRLCDWTTMGVGGPPKKFEEAISESDVVDAARDARLSGDPLFPLGGGSNIVVSDAGVPGTVLRIALTGIDLQEDGDAMLVTAAAGEIWHDFAALMTEEGLAGIECLGGIPGSVGATPIQNVGAYGQEVSQTVVRVRAIDRTTLKAREFSKEDCRFAYRNSVFKKALLDRYIVVSVTYRLARGQAPSIRYGELSRALESRGASPSLDEVFRTVVELRRAKSMVLDPEDENRRSCGSFFVNAQMTQDQLSYVTARAGEAPPTFPGDDGLVKVPSAWLIERAGLQKGTRDGLVGLSTKHTLSIVSHPGARAVDVVRFAHRIRKTVQEKFRIQLVPEPNFWGFSALEDGLPRL